MFISDVFIIILDNYISFQVFFLMVIKKNTWKIIQDNFQVSFLNLLSFFRRFYTRRNASGMSRRHCFFCSCTCVKVLFTDTFLKCRFRWKVKIISTFSLRTNAVFFLNQSFLCIHVNKVSHYNMGYSQSTI